MGLHGDMNQAQRNRTLEKFRRPGSRQILVATDVAARGLDIDDIDVVIQLDCIHVDSFVHRTGRTGRAGKEGRNIVFYEKGRAKFYHKIEKDLTLNFAYCSAIQDKNHIANE